MQTICQTLHLSKDQVVACGDANNDQAMFACAGWRVAMSNASSAIQEMCDAVVDNQDGAGVARAIQDNVESKKTEGNQPSVFFCHGTFLARSAIIRRSYSLNLESQRIKQRREPQTTPLRPL